MNLYYLDDVTKLSYPSYVKAAPATSAERLSQRNIIRDMSRVAIDATMVDDGFMADFLFDPSGKLEIDKVNFVALIERIIHGKE